MSQDLVLVTGASGNVGAEVARRLASAGVPVRGAARDPERAQAATGGVDCVPFDFENRSTWAGALAGARRLFLVRPPAIAAVDHSLNPFLDAAKESGVQHVVFLSLLGAERNPVVPHFKIERHILRIGLPYTFLRAGFFMQNLSTTHREEIRRGEIMIPAGRGRTAFIDIRDIADVAVVAFQTAGYMNQSYSLTRKELLDYYDVSSILSETLGRPIQYHNPSIWRFRQAMRASGHPSGFINVMTMLYLVVRFGRSGAITHEVEQLLGRPPVTLAEFARDHSRCWAL